MSEEEDLAAKIVSAVTGYRTERLDHGGGATQLPDFRLLNDNDEQIGLLEVTTTTRGERIRFSKARSKQDWHDPQLGQDWHVVVADAGVKLSGVRPRLAVALAALEAQGKVLAWQSNEPPYLDHGAEPLSAELAGIGVLRVRAMGPAGQPGRGWIHLSVASKGGFAGVEFVTRIVEAELGKKDNQRKLNGAAGQSSELFIWLDADQTGSSLIAFSDGPFTGNVRDSAGPELPAPISSVWVAALSADPGKYAKALWRASGGSWRIIDPPART